MNHSNQLEPLASTDSVSEFAQVLQGPTVHKLESLPFSSSFKAEIKQKVDLERFSVHLDQKVVFVNWQKEKHIAFCSGGTIPECLQKSSETLEFVNFQCV